MTLAPYSGTGLLHKVISSKHTKKNPQESGGKKEEEKRDVLS